MARYIDADTFDERVRISVGLVEEELTDDYKDGVRCTLEMLKTQPTADVIPIEWIKEQMAECIPYSIHWLSIRFLLEGWERREDDECI